MAEVVREIGKRGASTAALDQSRVGEVAARLMEALDEQGFGEDAQITDVMRIVAVDHEGGAATSIHSGNSVKIHLRKQVGRKMRGLLRDL